MRRNPPRKTPTSTSHDMSPNKIKFLQERITARQNLIKLLDRKGFKVSFNFELSKVEIETESEDISVALEFIHDSIVETVMPVDEQSLPLLEVLQTTFQQKEGMDVLVLPTDNRQSILIVGLKDGVQTFLSKSKDLVTKKMDAAAAPIKFVSSRSATADEDHYDVPSDSLREEAKTSKFYCKMGSVVESLHTLAYDVGISHRCDIKYTQTGSNRTSKQASDIVVCGRIQETEADVIFISTNSKLTLGVGAGMSTVILRVAGRVIQDELYRDYKDGIPFGEVARSSPGRLKNCKAIYYGSIPMFPHDRSRKDFQKEKKNCYGALFMTVINALVMASAEEWKSIAFPALGTGNLRYPPHEAIHLMYLAVNEFFNSVVSPIEKVLFVIYPSADPLLKQLFLMESFSRRLQTVMVDGTITTSEEWRKDAGTICETRYEFGKTFLQVTNSDIKAVCNVTDAVLILWEEDHIEEKKHNPVVSSLDISLQRDMFSKYVSQLKEKGIKFVMDTTSFKGTRLIHLYCKKDKDMEGVIERAIERGIKQLLKEDVTTIAIPVPSDGSRTWRPHIVAGIIIKSLQKLKSLHHVVRIIIQDSRQLEPFLASFLDKCSLQKKTDVPNVFDNFIPLPDRRVPVGDTEIQISSESQTKNEQAAKDLKARLEIKLMYMLKDK